MCKDLQNWNSNIEQRPGITIDPNMKLCNINSGEEIPVFTVRIQYKCEDLNPRAVKSSKISRKCFINIYYPNLD